MKKQNKQSEPSFYVNFEKVYARNIDSNISLLNFLRHNCKFTGTKEGCSEGDCGACSVLIFDEKGSLAPVNSCILKVGQIIDKNILYGSWAGAFGNFQFMPRTINNYAINFNKNDSIELKKTLTKNLNKNSKKSAIYHF